MLTLVGAVVAIPVQLVGACVRFDEVKADRSMNLQYADIQSSRAYVLFVDGIPICAKSTFFSDQLNIRYAFKIS